MFAARSAAVGPRPEVEESLDGAGHGLVERPLLRPVVGGAADRDQDQGDRSRGGANPAAEAGERAAEAEPPVADLERGEPSEHPEVDGEGLPAAQPRLGPEQRHAGEGQRRVRDGGDRHRARGEADGLKTALPVHELQPQEGDEPGDRGPAAEPLGIAERRRRGLARDQPEPATESARDRPPGVEGAEDVAEQDAENDQPEPEGDEDEGEREVAIGGVRPLEAGPYRHRQQEDAERAGQQLGDRIDQEPREPARSRTPVLGRQQRAPPGDGHDDEGDDQDQRRPPGEQPLGDRQVLAADQGVGGRRLWEGESRGRPDDDREGGHPGDHETLRD